MPQLYLEAPASRPAGAQFAPKTLVGFDRVSLQAGEEKSIQLTIEPRSFQYWSAPDKQWKIPEGARTLNVGLSSGELVLAAEIEGSH